MCFSSLQAIHPPLEHFPPHWVLVILWARILGLSLTMLHLHSRLRNPQLLAHIQSTSAQPRSHHHSCRSPPVSTLTLPSLSQGRTQVTLLPWAPLFSSTRHFHPIRRSWTSHPGTLPLRPRPRTSIIWICHILCLEVAGNTWASYWISSKLWLSQVLVCHFCLFCSCTGLQLSNFTSTV